MLRNLFFLEQEGIREKAREEETTSWPQSSNLLKDKQQPICITCKTSPDSLYELTLHFLRWETARYLKQEYMKQRLFTNDVEVYRKECNCCTYINDRTLDFIEFSETE